MEDALCKKVAAIQEHQKLHASLQRQVKSPLASICGLVLALFRLKSARSDSGMKKRSEKQLSIRAKQHIVKRFDR